MTHWAAIFLVPGGAAIIMIVKMRVTVNMTLGKVHKSRSMEHHISNNETEIPIIQEAILEQSFDDVTGFLFPYWGYSAV